VDYFDLRSSIQVYTDVSPTYCNDACVANGMWGTDGGSACVNIYGGRVCGSVDDAFRDNSYGAMSWPSSEGRVISVNMGKAAPTGNCNAMLDGEMALAHQKAQAQFGVDTASYAHREYFVPDAFGDCAWGGYAQVGCNRAGFTIGKLARLSRNHRPCL